MRTTNLIFGRGKFAALFSGRAFTRFKDMGVDSLSDLGAIMHHGLTPFKMSSENFKYGASTRVHVHRFIRKTNNNMQTWNIFIGWNRFSCYHWPPNIFIYFYQNNFRNLWKYLKMFKDLKKKCLKVRQALGTGNSKVWRVSRELESWGAVLGSPQGQNELMVVV